MVSFRIMSGATGRPERHFTKACLSWLPVAFAAGTTACVISGGKPYWAWAVPPLPSSPPVAGCEPLQPGSGSLVRVRVADEADYPLPGVTVRLHRGKDAERAYVTNSDGNADAWVPSGTWSVRADLVGFRDGEGDVEVAEDRFCQVGFRLPLDHAIE